MFELMDRGPSLDGLVDREKIKLNGYIIYTS
jgi:hypothetical protein